MGKRMGALIAQYASQGAHRTGTISDDADAAWLVAHAQAVTKGAAARITIQRSNFPMVRRDILAASITIETQEGTWSAPGVPLYDCAEYTDIEGVTGTLGHAGEDCDIAVVEYSTAALADAANAPDLMLARNSSRHKAVIAIYVPPQQFEDGLALINADSYLNCFGKPTLQIQTKHRLPLQAALKQHASGHVVACMSDTQTEAANVSIEVQGTDPNLSPIIVLTPRSGWWSCAVERGSGIAAFIEILRAVASSQPKRTVLFVALTGHELGHLGNSRFWDQRPGFLQNAYICFHLGSSWACECASAPGNKRILLQVSDAKTNDIAVAALTKEGIPMSGVYVVDGSARPVGEAKNLYDAGARYVSIINLGLESFHMEEDREVAVQMSVLAQLTRAFTAAVLISAQGSSSGSPPGAKM